MYDISGNNKVREWLAAHEDPDARLALLEWLPRLAADPEGVSLARRNRPGIPVFTAEVPEIGCWVTYSVADQFNIVHILRIDDPPAVDP